MKQTFTLIAFLFLYVTVFSTVTYAIGTLTPQGTPGDDTQYTLNDIYNKLIDFTDSATEGSGSMTVPGTISATFNTLSDIYALLEAEEEDLVPENIAEGVEIFGVEGTMSEGVIYPTEWSTDSLAEDFSWSTAISYCENLEEDSHTDWRLPTAIELLNAHLTGVSGFQGQAYVSSSESLFDSSFAHWIHMSYGNISDTGKSDANYSARCVR